MNTFKALGLNEAILQAVSDMGFTEPSEVQEKAIPVLLKEATDVVALAQTGTGKTAAFGFPLIQKIDANNRKTQGLIISPTRELCLQITNELKNYSKHVKGLNVVAVYGGANIQEQARQISRGAQIIVATPGRMQDMMRRNLVDISTIDFCVLDEADEMLNMGFYEDITTILADTPKGKQTWLFSATMPKEVARIAKQFMNSPIEITVGTKNEGADSVSHEYYMVNARDRYQALKRLADANPEIFSVVFCRTKRDTQKVAEQLIEDGYNASALHGDLSQNQRDLVMKSFRARQIQMLVATDVAARGIDVDDITHVINYQLPDEIETYTHRSGRTGRAGKTGISMVIVSKSELRKIRTLEKIINKQFVQKDIPTGMEICEVQLMHLANDIQGTKINEEINPYLYSINEVLEGISREDLIKKVFSVEFTRFFNYYQKTKDLNVAVKADMKEESGESTRYFINIGAKDGFDWMSLKDFLKDATGLGEGIYKVDCKDSFSFFNTDTENKDTILALFEDFKLQGRQVHVEVTKDTRGGGGGGKRKRNDRKGGGGKRRNDFGGDGDFKKRKSSSGRKERSSGGGERRGKRKPDGPKENKSPFSGKRRRRDR
ncbi:MULTISPECIES: DEAD/DEAH box helicase [unclassified Leeuwenhoekiella]|uniref:DEAD/DEAH box helicase n=1 Tax=unclassified Leeuwenhoekiella TaxID=2615029 RepID=UPI000C572779|nr:MULTISPECIES: DEAD/DEAH box helicase [unclassified Leeuwenhoekiella]MAW94727.1 ATP-dependent RNA helicase [Leeuwenhoekiella sp.]MAW95502.1 ATP-dependent RNA helicase [Leeuwenhoekiella sp.]MBA82150.1 ATP-dependent RNA helicase [Leeuwenhoekiella sp.]|tara:strand:- start:4997 stop:6811 length:1815 start_codon:yes stop_codon:yes gene_type:complete